MLAKLRAFLKNVQFLVIFVISDNIGILAMSNEISQHALLREKTTAQDKLKVFMSTKCHMLMCRRNQPKKTLPLLDISLFQVIFEQLFENEP